MADTWSRRPYPCAAWGVALACAFLTSPTSGHGDASGDTSAPSTVTGQVIRQPGSTDASLPTPRLQTLAGWFGLTQEDIQFSPPELFDCLRAYGSLPERFVAVPLPKPDGEALAKRLEERIKADDRIIALFLMHIPNSGGIYCREATGVYEHFRSYANGVTVIALRGADAVIVPMDDPTRRDESTVDDDYLQPWLDPRGTLRIRESQSITGVDDVSFAWFVNDLTPNVLLGSWSDYLARKPVLLEFSQADQEKRVASEKQVLESDVMEDLARGGVLGALDSLQWDEAKAAQMAKRLERAEVSVEVSPRNIQATSSRLFVLGDYLLLQETHGEDEFFTISFSVPSEK